MNIDFLGVFAEAFVDGARLCRQSLIGFYQVEIVRVPASEFQRFLRSWDWPGTA